MLAKLTSKNQLTLPKAVLETVGTPDYLEVTEEGGRIVLTPVRITRADAVRGKLKELGISEDDVAAAVEWGWYGLEVYDLATGAASSVRFQAGWRAGPVAGAAPDKVKVTLDQASYRKAFASYRRSSIWRPYTIHWLR